MKHPCITISAAKVRISEQNAKGKLVFLFFFERKYLRHMSKVRISEQNAKGKLVFLFIFRNREALAMFLSCII